jgi:hypothetical protein
MKVLLQPEGIHKPTVTIGFPLWMPKTLSKFGAFSGSGDFRRMGIHKPTALHGVVMKNLSLFFTRIIGALPG